MAITRTTAFQISDGNTYPSLEIAQRAELLKLLKPANWVDADLELQHINEVLDTMFGNLDAVKQILSCTGRKPRKAKNGAARKRKTAVKVGGAE